MLPFLVCAILIFKTVDLLPSESDPATYPHPLRENNTSDPKCPLLNNKLLSELRQQCISISTTLAVDVLDDRTRRPVLCDIFLSNLNVTCGRLQSNTMQAALLNKQPIMNVTDEAVCKHLLIIPSGSQTLRKLISTENICKRICVDYSGNVEPLCLASYYLNVEVPHVFARLRELSQRTNFAKQVDNNDATGETQNKAEQTNATIPKNHSSAFQPGQSKNIDNPEQKSVILDDSADTAIKPIDVATELEQSKADEQSQKQDVLVQQPQLVPQYTQLNQIEPEQNKPKSTVTAENVFPVRDKEQSVPQLDLSSQAKSSSPAVGEVSNIELATNVDHAGKNTDQNAGKDLSVPTEFQGQTSGVQKKVNEQADKETKNDGNAANNANMVQNIQPPKNEAKQEDDDEEEKSNYTDAEAEGEPDDTEKALQDDGEMEVPSKVVDVPQKVQKPPQTDNSAVNYTTAVDGDSYFFPYFMMLCLVIVLVYVGYHNKQKIRAIVLEGPRARRSSRGRRPNSANYHKLDSNLEEAVTSSCTKNTSHIIY